MYLSQAWGFVLLRLAAYSAAKIAGIFLIASSLTIFAANAFGQASGSGIVGVVRDQSGSAIPRGLMAGNNAYRVGDINISGGGPILKDRLWFFSTFRRWYADNYLANTFTPTGEQALDDNRLTDATLRLSANLNKNNRLSVSYDRGWKWRGHRINNFISASFSDPQADVVQTNWLNYMLQSKLTSTISSRLIAEVG
jgi:hypothetical protein